MIWNTANTVCASMVCSAEICHATKEATASVPVKQDYTCSGTLITAVHSDALFNEVPVPLLETPLLSAPSCHYWLLQINAFRLCRGTVAVPHQCVISPFVFRWVLGVR